MKSKGLDGIKKLVTFIGLAAHVLYYVLALLSLGDYEYSGHGMGRAFGYWILAMLVAVIVIAVYFSEAMYSVITHVCAFNVLKLLLVLAAVPLWVYIGCAVGVRNSIIWNTFFAILFGLEILSLFVKDRLKQ